MTSSIEGTESFLAPECCSFENTSYSMKKADIWSLGVTFYCMAFNRLPYTIGSTNIDIYDNIRSHELFFTGRFISEDLKEFLTMMLEKDPS
jgi:serine/threonine protein kinase